MSFVAKLTQIKNLLADAINESGDVKVQISGADVDLGVDLADPLPVVLQDSLGAAIADSGLDVNLRALDTNDDPVDLVATDDGELKVFEVGAGTRNINTRVMDAVSVASAGNSDSAPLPVQSCQRLGMIAYASRSSGTSTVTLTIKVSADGIDYANYVGTDGNAVTWTLTYAANTRYGVILPALPFPFALLNFAATNDASAATVFTVEVFGVEG